MKANTLERVLSYILEIFSLTNLKRSGWRAFGIPEEERESVAEHIFEVSYLALILASMEELPETQWDSIVFMALIHDNPEARIGDIDKIAASYLRTKNAFHRAFYDQVANLPYALKNKLLKSAKMLEKESKEAILVKDADLLDFALRGLLFAQRGYKLREKVESLMSKLKTASAKALLQQALMEESLATLWTENLELTGDPR